MRAKRGEITSCRVLGCKNCGKFRLGFCSKHYMRNRAHGLPTGGATDRGAALLFLEKASKCIHPDCLIWPFSKNKQGYACVKKPNSSRSANNIICEMVNGPKPTEKHEAAHNCGKGNQGCVNGSHLRWATRKENMADTVAHGTSNRGERQHLAKLTREDVFQIRALEGSMSQVEIGKKFGVTNRNIHLILKRKSWAWLEEGNSGASAKRSYLH